MSVGQLWSTSSNACIIEFVGGPYHGQSGLYDHHHWASIQFSDCGQKQTHVYRPLGDGRRYYYERAFSWST